MTPPPDLLADLAHLLGLLLAPEGCSTLSDRQRLNIARLQAELILKRVAAEVYPHVPARPPVFEPSEN